MGVQDGSDEGNCSARVKDDFLWIDAKAKVLQGPEGKKHIMSGLVLGGRYKQPVIDVWVDHGAFCVKVSIHRHHALCKNTWGSRKAEGKSFEKESLRAEGERKSLWFVWM